MVTEVPGISRPLPPNGSDIDKNWRPTMNESLSNGQTFTIDKDYRIGGLDSIGLNSADFPEGTEVVGRIADEIDAAANPGSNGIDISIVKYPHKSGLREYFIVSDIIDESGQQSKKWTPIPTGVELTIGRRTEDSEAQGQSFIDGVDLTGTNFSNDISRKHFTIKNVYGGGLEVSGFGTNGTKVEAVKLPNKEVEPVIDQRVQAAGDVAVHSEVGYDPVIEAENIVNAAEAQDVISPEQQERNKWTDLLKASQSGIDETISGIDDKDARTKLFSFGTASAYYRETARREENSPTHLGHRNVEGAYDLAIRAERALPDSVKAVADTYRVHRVNKALAESQLAELN